MPTVQINIDPDLFLPVYQHLLGSKNDIELLYGSRDSGKSRHIAQQLVVKCMEDEYFLCPMIRKVANTVKDSQWQMVKSVVEDWGLEKFFTFNVSPLEIRCANGNKFLTRGLDDPKKIKSLTNPSCAWIEEGSDLDTEDWVLILTSLRSNFGRTQTWVSFNPDMPTDYEETFLWKTFFENRQELTFQDVLTIETSAGVARINFGVTHSTYKDNRFCPPERIFHYENLKNINEYEYTVYAQGLWGKRITGGEFFSGFKMAKHVKFKEFNPNRIVHFSIDYNVLPYIAITCIQLYKNDDNTWLVNIFKEMPCREPINSAKKAGEYVVGWLKKNAYNQKVYIYGDRSTKNRNGIDDDKRSFFDIFTAAIKTGGYVIEDKMAKYAPSVSTLGDFVNAIFDGSLTFAQIIINQDCKTIINDYIDTKKDKDGTILKRRIKDELTEISYEPNGHFVDNLKDFMFQCFPAEFDRFQNRFKTPAPAAATVSRVPRVTL